jgi:hypothetical protein
MRFITTLGSDVEIAVHPAGAQMEPVTSASSEGMRDSAIRPRALATTRATTIAERHSERTAGSVSKPTGAVSTDGEGPAKTPW